MVMETQSNQAGSRRGGTGGILLVMAHPDDETFMGGATLAKYARQGVATALLCFTDGQAGRLGPSDGAAITTREAVGAVRRSELLAAARLFGIGEVLTPGWMDGTLTQVPDEVGVAEVVRAIRRLRPRVVISFGGEGGPNRHGDHKTTARWAELALDAAADTAYEVPDGVVPVAGEAHAVERYYWVTWPNAADHLRGTTGSPATHVVELGADMAALKRQAFAVHETQADHHRTFAELCDTLAGKEYFHQVRGNGAENGARMNAAIKGDLFD
jgi:LmbE family N-acetylglucosaminyl deacetylase